jgi:hypothetical protein
MKNIFFLFVLMFCFLLPGNSIAQSNIAPGYIVNKSNDTIKGMITDRDWDVSPDSISFTTNGNTTPKYYSPNDISSFGVDGKYYYISRKIILDISPYKEGELWIIDGTDTSQMRQLINDTISKQVFLNVLVAGKISLYFHKDETGKEHYFCQKDGTRIDELIFRKYIQERDKNKIYSGERYEVTIERYRNQLTYYMSDFPKLNDQINSTKYSLASLVKIVVDYNNLSAPGTDFYVQHFDENKTQFGIVGGFYSSRIGPQVNLNNISFPADNSFTFGASLKFISSKQFNRHMFCTELLYKPLYTVASGQNISNYATNNITYTLDYAYLKMNIFYRYIFERTKDLDFFFDFGLSFAYALKSNNYETVKSNFFGTITNETYSLGDPGTYEFAILGGLGVSKNQFSFDIRYEVSNNFGNLPGLKPKFFTFYALFGYSF